MAEKLKVRFYFAVKAWAGFEVSGHASYAEAGSDIVCSAVSALVQAAAMGLSEHAAAVDKLIIEEGYMRLTLKRNLSRERAVMAEAILETMRLGLNGIRDEFPKNIDISVMEEQP